jgi:hypothetical protein
MCTGTLIETTVLTLGTVLDGAKERAERKDKETWIGLPHSETLDSSWTE